MTDPLTEESFEFDLPDGGTGGEHVSANDLAAEGEAVLAVLIRSHYDPYCREVVQDLRDRYDELAAQSATVVAVLPDDVDRASLWSRRYELPFPVLADVDDTDADDPSHDAFRPFAQYIPDLPGVVAFEPAEDGLVPVATFGGDGKRAFPSVDDLLDWLDDRNPSADAAGEESSSSV